MAGRLFSDPGHGPPFRFATWSLAHRLGGLSTECSHPACARLVKRSEGSVSALTSSSSLGSIQHTVVRFDSAMLARCTRMAPRLR